MMLVLFLQDHFNKGLQIVPGERTFFLPGSLPVKRQINTYDGKTATHIFCQGHKVHGAFAKAMEAYQ